MASESKPAAHVTLCHISDTYRKTHDPYPLNPYPRVRVQVSWGTGMGSPGKPQGYPCQSLIAAAVRAQGKIALCVASSGIASLLLEGGRTAHSTFKIPLQINDTSFCGISQQSHAYPLLCQTSIMIWDEVPMQHKYAVDAVERLGISWIITLHLVASLYCSVVILDKPFQLFLMDLDSRL